MIFHTCFVACFHIELANQRSTAGLPATRCIRRCAIVAIIPDRKTKRGQLDQFDVVLNIADLGCCMLDNRPQLRSTFYSLSRAETVPPFPAVYFQRVTPYSGAYRLPLPSLCNSHATLIDLRRFSASRR